MTACPRFARRLALAVACLTAAGIAGVSALDYPTKPVRIVVAYAPSGATDIMARLMAQWLTERLGQPFMIENRSGAGGNIGTEAAVRAPPDGYTLLVAASPNAINATLYDKLNLIPRWQESPSLRGLEHRRLLPSARQPPARPYRRKTQSTGRGSRTGMQAQALPVDAAPVPR
jgi:hypothetical protein